MSLFPNSEQTRLAEKLARMANKRGADSPHAAELERLTPSEGVKPQKPQKKVTEKPADAPQE